VRVVNGTFVDMTGQILSHEQAQERLRAAGQPTWRPYDETIWVLIEIYARPVAVQLEPFQIERA
jgi:hypothetical protein